MKRNQITLVMLKMGVIGNNKVFLLISNVLPKNTTGGEVVLYRHLLERKFMDFEIIDDKEFLPKTWWKKLISKIGIRLERTRFRAYTYIFKPFYDQFDINPDLLNKYKLLKPSFILTVAHDRMCFRAQKLAKVLNVPLVTIFHDWYPVTSFCHHSYLFFMEKEFRVLYKDSALAFGVSKQMLQKLGKHENAHVLWPIPGKKEDNFYEKESKETKIAYAGFCGGAYAKMLRKIIEVIKTTPKISLSMMGYESEKWKENTSSFENIDIKGLVDRSEYVKTLNEADLLIVLIPFNKDAQIHFSTHFPSKLIDYAGFHKPLLIWGPSYATSVQWAKNNNTAYIIENKDSKEFYEFLNTFELNKNMLREKVQKMTEFYKNNWEPEIIHHTFESEIMKLIRHA